MQPRNRGQIEIIGCILAACINSCLKTHFMYECNLNSEQLQHYVRLLLDCGLLERLQEQPDSRYKYKTTSTGRTYVNQYKKLVGLLKSGRDRVEGRFDDTTPSPDKMNPDNLLDS